MTLLRKALADRSKLKKGFTLVELCIACVLMSFIFMLVMAIIGLASESFVAAERQVSMLTAETEFASKITESIRESTVAFTVPERSFTLDKLTSGWNYLGLMKDVEIPKSVNRSGRTGERAEALVYIEYVGETAPPSVPSDANLLATASDGYFIQHVLDYSFTDSSGSTYDYNLVFTPKDDSQAPSGALKYSFTVDVTDADGTTRKASNGLDIDSIINAVNAVQVVYKGSRDNPATALAFNSNYMPTYSTGSVTTKKVPATIVLVMDMSLSMDGTILNDDSENHTTTRIAGLKEKVNELVDKYKENEKVHFILIPYSDFTGCQTTKRTYSVRDDYIWRGSWVYNAKEDYDSLKSRIDNLTTSGNGTNTGDGLRVGYYMLQDFVQSGEETGPIYFIVITDGEMNMLSVSSSVGTRSISDGIFYFGNLTSGSFYYGSSTDPLQVSGRYYYYNFRTIARYTSSGSGPDKDMARSYASYWCKKIASGFDIEKKWMLCIGDSSKMEKDKAMLQDDLGATPIDVESMTDFDEIFNLIGENLDNSMWAFEGPRN